MYVLVCMDAVWLDHEVLVSEYTNMLHAYIPHHHEIVSSWLLDTAGSSVFNSSMHMFNFIKTAIKRCTALTKGPAFMALSLEFKKSMQNYAQMLRDRLPFIITNMQVCAHTICLYGLL
jgi:hypothetical protein